MPLTRAPGATPPRPTLPGRDKKKGRTPWGTTLRITMVNGFYFTMNALFTTP